MNGTSLNDITGLELVKTTAFYKQRLASSYLHEYKT